MMKTVDDVMQRIAQVEILRADLQDLPELALKGKENEHQVNSMINAAREFLYYYINELKEKPIRQNLEN